ncbi:hypothetical protein BH24CHL6_BH24CHL6_07940 [soil metagenome]
MPGLPVEQLAYLVFAALAALTLGLLAVALRSDRVDNDVLLAGARIGLLIAAGLGVAIVALVTLLLNGQPILFESRDLAGAFRLGLLIGVPLAVGYFWLGLALVAGGLLGSAPPDWARRGAWLVTPVVAIVVISAVGFGLAAVQRDAEPTVVERSGQVEPGREGTWLIGPLAGGALVLQLRMAGATPLPPAEVDSRGWPSRSPL